MKSYNDFVADTFKEPTLVKQLEGKIPFADSNALTAWFSAQGYELSSHEAAMLFDNQTALTKGDDMVNY